MPKINLSRTQARALAPSGSAGLVRAQFQASDFGTSNFKQAGETYAAVVRQQDAKTRMDMRKTIAQDRLDLNKKILEMEQNAELGAPGHDDAVEALVAQRMEASKQKYEKRFHTEFEANYASIRSNAQVTAMRFSSAQGAAKMANDISSVTDNNIELVSQDPMAMAAASQDIDALKANLEASGNYSQQAIDNAIKEQRERLGNAYADSLIFNAPDEQTLDAIKEDLPGLAQGMTPKAVKAALKNIEIRRDQIQKDVHNDFIKEGKAAIRGVMIDYQAALRAGTPEAQARIESGEFAARIEPIVKKYGVGLDQLGTVSGKQAAFRRQALREMNFTKADAQAYAAVDTKFKAYKGELTIEQIEELKDTGELTQTQYNSVMSARRTYDQLEAAKARRDKKEIERLEKKRQREEKQLAKQKAGYDAQNTIVDISHGLIKPEDIPGVIAGLPEKYQPQARRAAKSWESKDAKQRETEQKQAAMSEYEYLRSTFIKPRQYKHSGEVMAAVDAFEERFKDLLGGYGMRLANNLRQTAKGLNHNEHYVAGVQATTTAAMANTSGRPTIITPDLMPAAEKKMHDAAWREMERAWIDDAKDIQGEVTWGNIQRYREKVALSVNYLPDYIVEEARLRVRSGDPQEMQQAATDIVRWSSLHHSFGDRFEDGDFKRAVDIAGYIKKGWTAEQAMAAVDNLENQSDNDKRARAFTWQAKDNGIESSPHKHVTAARDLDLEDGEKDFLKTLDDHPNAMAAFNAIVRDAYMSGSEYDSALTFATKKMQQQWGVTRIGGVKRMMRFAPDTAYGVAVLTDKQNVEWIEEQFAENVSKKVGHKADPKDITILLDPRTENGRPTYMAYYQGQVVLRGAVPDPADSPRASQNIEIRKEFIKYTKEQQEERIRAAEAEKHEQEREIRRVRSREKKRGGRGQSLNPRDMIPEFEGAPEIDETTP